MEERISSVLQLKVVELQYRSMSYLHTTCVELPCGESTRLTAVRTQISNHIKNIR